VSPDSTHSPDIVTAVIVAHDGAAWLPRVMDAVAKQTRSLQRVVAVDTGSTDRSGSMLAQAFGRPAVFGMERGTGYGTAIAKALRHRAANAHVPLAGTSREDRTEWVWLLHDDSEPAPDALEQLLAGTREAPAAAVFGPKIMDWSDRDVLLEAGTTIDRAGRRITGIEPREVDQGQHDGNRDVVAVSSAGMLARREVWEQVGGFDPGMRLFREDTDFCWRVQAAGYRVRVVTDAVVYHVEATARNRRDAPAAQHRRRQDRRNALLVLTGNLPARPMFAALAGNLVLSTLRTVFFLLAKRPSAALDELAAYTSAAAHPLRLMSARRIRARGRQQAFARLAKDLPPGRSFRMLAEYATSTLSKTLPADAVGSHHATDDPSDDDSLLVDTGLAQRLLTSPGVLLFLILTVVALVAERSLLGATPLGGGALVPAWGGVSGLWQEYLQGFHPVSIGTSANAPPYVVLLAILATVLGGKPWLAVDVILLGCVPLAGVTAFLATRRVTSYVPARVVGALAYALLPVGMGAVAAGRLGTAVLLVLLPPVAVLVGRIFTAPRRRARRAAWAAGLLTAVVAALVPLFWLIAAVVMAVGLIALRRRDRALDAVIVVVVPLLLLLPWTLDIAAHPARIFLEAGLARPGLASASLAPRSLLLLSPGGPGLPPYWVTAGLVLAATVAVVISGRRRVVLAGWAVGVTGLITAAAVSRVAISEAGSTAAVRAWPGPALAIAGAGLLLAVVAAGDEVPGLLRAGRWRGPAGLAVIALGAVTLSAPALAAAHWVTSGVTGPVRPAAGTLLPEFVAVSSDTGGERLRTLVLQAAPHGGVSYLVLRDSDPLIGSQELALPTAGEQVLSKTVATLTAPSGSAVTDQGRALAGFGIGYVLLPAPVSAGLARLLDDVPGLRPVSATLDFQLWRVVGTTARATVAESGGTVVPVASGQAGVTAARAPSAGGTLMLAEPAGGWSATLNGHPLTSLAAPVNGWAQGFRLPAGGGSLSVSHSNFARTAVVALEGLAVLVVIGLGLPGSRTAAEAEQEEAAGGDEALGAPAPGRRRAGHGREPGERSRRRRTPRRGEDEPQLPPGTEVLRPAKPARSFARRAAAVPAGVRVGWPRRGGTPGAEDPSFGEEAHQGDMSYPGSDSFPGEASRPGGRGYPASPVPEQPGSAGRGRRAAADLTSETIAYRPPNGDSTGRHSHRAGQGQAPAAELGGPQQDYATPTAALGRDAGPGYDTGPGYAAGAGRDTGLPSRGGQDAPRSRGIGSRRARRDQGLPGAQGDGPRGHRPFGGRGTPQAGPADGPGDEPQADREARERFSLPLRRGAAGQDRPGRFGRFGRGSAQEAPGGPAQPAARGGGAYDSGGPRSGGYRGEGHSSGPYPIGSYQGDRSPGGGPSGHPSGPYPSDSPQGGRSAGGGPGGYDDLSHPSGPLPTGPYRGGGPAGGSGGSYDDAAHPSGPYPSGSYQGGRSGAGGPGGAHPSGPYPSGSYQGGRSGAGGPGGAHPSGPYPSGSYQGGRSGAGGPGGAHPSGPYPTGSYQGSGPQGGGYDGGSHAGGPASGGTGQAPERGRGRRGRSPGHARTSRPGTSGPGGPAQQPGRGPAGDDDALLAPLPPLPPRVPRRGQWDDAGQDRGPGDDQGEADW
jgi:GT2 family glycosyltransferase